MMQKWEYKSVPSVDQNGIYPYKAKDATHPNYINVNHLGLEGWELMSVQPDPDNKKYFVWVFKRPLPDNQLEKVSPESVECYNCHNTRMVDCVYCGGNKKIHAVTGEKLCPVCHGAGQIKCRECIDGECEHCQGRGRFFTEYGEDRPCKLCGGTGRKIV